MADNPTGESCNLCMFFKAAPRGRTGICRKRAPVQVETIATNPHVRWAEVSNSDWCGEFQAAE